MSRKKPTPAKTTANEDAPEGKAVAPKFKKYTIPSSGKVVDITRAKKKGKFMHYYFVNPTDRKEHRVIKRMPE